MEIVQENFNLQIICHTVRMLAASWDFHWHENIEICQVMKNRCRFLIDGVQVEADEGDLIVVSAYTIHRFLIQEDDTYIRICQFPSKLLLQANTPILPLRSHIPLSEIAQIPDLPDALRAIFAMMEAEKPLYTGETNPFLQSLAPALYLLLMRHFADDTIQNTGKDRMEFYRITDYINAHLNAPLTAQSMAHALFLSRGRLTSLFARYAGVSLHEYIHSLRIQKANALMAQGLSVTDAALESGFQCIRTFNSVYKRLTGETPTEYRNRKNGISDTTSPRK